MSLDSVLVSNVMKIDVKTENENQDVMAACKVMYNNDIGCVVVIKEQGKDKIPVGIITERDIVRALGRLTVFLSMPLSKFMNKPIISIQSHQSIRQAMQLMDSRNVKRLIVVDSNDKMVGIITEKDILSRIVKDPNMITDFVDHNYQKGREIYARFTERMLHLLPKL
jgi:predicted transcriptional regulator